MTHSNSEQSRSSSDTSRRLLPAGYVLHDNDVYCGRGFLCFNHIGNHRFRQLVSTHIQRYNSSMTKFQKSLIIQEVVDHVRSMSKEGGFVKRDMLTGQYYEVGDFHAREKTSQEFRNALCGKYKSSRLGKMIKSKPSKVQEARRAQLVHFTGSTLREDIHLTTIQTPQCIRNLASAQNMKNSEINVVQDFQQKSKTTLDSAIEDDVTAIMQTNAVIMQNNALMTERLLSSGVDVEDLLLFGSANDPPNAAASVSSKFISQDRSNSLTSSICHTLPTTNTVLRNTSIGWIATSSSVTNVDGFDAFIIDDRLFDLTPSSSMMTGETIVSDDEDAWNPSEFFQDHAYDF